MNRLAGKVAIITGGARGMGAATCRLFVEQGAKVAIADLLEAEGRALAAELGDAARFYHHDVSSEESWAALMRHVQQDLGAVDVLVNNAGITQPLKLMDIKRANYDAVLDVSLRGTLHMSQAVLPTMKNQKSGSIISISSVSAQKGGGILGGPHYSAAKAGVLGLTRAIARDFGPFGIRANCITPGLIATDINKGKIPEDKLAGILASIPLGNIGEPADIGGACVFLASDLAKYCTGITLDVNGGMLIH